jgi:hypothetical protein
VKITANTNASLDSKSRKELNEGIERKDSQNSNRESL